jgi:uncharacterized protein (DUF433 family)
MPDLTPDGIIHDRGRGPEIKGTRITVYDILDYHRNGRDPEFIAHLLRLTVEQVLVATRYIEEHKEEVLAAYQEMLDLAARGNPPHVRAWLEEAHKKLMAKKRALGERKAAGGGTGDARAAG